MPAASYRSIHSRVLATPSASCTRDARGVVAKARIIRELATAHHLAECRPQRLGVGADGDPAVAGAEHLIGRARAMRLAQARRVLAGGEEMRRFVKAEGEGGIVKRGVDVLAAAGACACVQRRQ